MADPLDLDEIRKLIDNTDCACTNDKCCQYHCEYAPEVLTTAIRLDDEVERLRTMYVASQGALTEFLTEHREYTEEITRLQEALEKIRDELVSNLSVCFKLKDIARAAREPK